MIAGMVLGASILLIGILIGYGLGSIKVPEED